MMARTCNELDSADGCSILLPVERPPKMKNGLKKTEKKASSGGISSLASNNKEPAFTLITKFAAQVCSLFEPKYKWMVLLILFGKFLSGANGQGVDVQREDFRSITIATSETEVATYSVPTPVDGANYLIYTRDEDKPESFKCTPKFVEDNKSCTLEVGDKDKTECEGLQIFRNETHTHLTVDGSKLTHACTVVCILQHFPGLHTLYSLALFKDQDNVQQEFPRNINIAPNSTVDATDLVPIPAPKTNGYKVAFFILLGIIVFILLVIAIVIKENFPCIRAWWEEQIKGTRTTIDTEQDGTTARLNPDRTNGHAVEC